MTKIDELTDEQWAAVREARAEWLRVGTCTELADRPEAEAAFASLYARASLAAPRVLWVDGPAAAAIMIAEQKRSPWQPSLWFSILRVKLRDSLGVSIGDRLGASLWDRLGSSLALVASLRSCLVAGLQDSLQARLEALEYGQEHAYWVAHYVTCRDVVGVRYTDEQNAHLAEWERLVRSCGWWAPFEDLVIACERHRLIRMDDRDLLHCEDGPAVECRDGHRVYAWHGTLVPAEWIEQRTSLDPAIALTWKDIEQRRCAAEIIGWHRVLELLDARTVDQDVDPSVGCLVEVELPGAGLERFLVVRCGTGRTFALPVPPQMQTALEANAWTYGVEPELLRLLEVRT